MVHGRLTGARQVSMQDGKHEFVSDVSADVGGDDAAPDPHQLIEAALVGCTLQTMQIYAQRKGWDVGATRVTVRVLEEGAAVRFGREIQFDPTLTAEQVERLTGIADKCPIHKLLRAPTTIETTVTT